MKKDADVERRKAISQFVAALVFFCVAIAFAFAMNKWGMWSVWARVIMTLLVLAGMVIVWDVVRDAEE